MGNPKKDQSKRNESFIVLFQLLGITYLANLTPLDNSVK